MSSEYNYDAAIDLIRKAYANGETVPYQQLEEVMGLKDPITSSSSANNSAISKLRGRLKREHGLVFKSAANGRHTGPEYHYYIVSEVKGEAIHKKAAVKSVKTTEAALTLDALSRDNQKLYAEVERLREENQHLFAENLAYANRENEYKTIIQSLMNLAHIL